MDSEIKEEFAAVQEELGVVRTDLGAARADLRSVDDRLRAIEARVREESVATRRHFDVVAESVRDDIRIIAEGFVALDAKVESLRGSR